MRGNERPGSAFHRIRALLAARLSSGPRGGFPVAAIFAQGFLAGVLCGLARAFLPPFAYGVFALSLTSALLAVPLLGELGWMLRADEAEEWTASLPARTTERNTARILHLLAVLGALALGSLVPAALFAPMEVELHARLLLPVLGLGQAAFLAATLLAVQSLLGGRAEPLFVLFQTALVVLAVVGLVLGLRHLPELAGLPLLGDPEATLVRLWPPAWFAAPLAGAEGEPARWWLPALAGALSLAVLILVRPPHARRGATEPWLARLLRPARALATRTWVRPDERGAFNLVYDALPREREVVLRTYPMIGIPLAFLVVAVAGPESGRALGREDLLALLFFTAGVYLPILLTHVPASESSEASWLHRTSPAPEGAIASGAIKALAVRFLLPLYLVLAFIGWFHAGPRATLLLAPPGALASLAVLRLLYPVCAADRPLSVSPDRLRTDLDWIGVLGGLALVLTLVAFFVRRTGALTAAALVAALLVLELALGRSLRRRLG